MNQAQAKSGYSRGLIQYDRPSCRQENGLLCAAASG